jgi:hypothetical protein
MYECLLHNNFIYSSKTIIFLVTHKNPYKNRKIKWSRILILDIKFLVQILKMEINVCKKSILLGDAVKTLNHRIPTHHKNHCIKILWKAGQKIGQNSKRNLCNLCRKFGRLLE